MENSSKKLVIKIFKYYFYFYIFVSLSVFILPRNILDKSEICTIFVNFMKQFFPNIKVFESVSSLPQLTAFYTSFMWVFGIIMAIVCFFVFLAGAKAIKNTIIPGEIYKNISLRFTKFNSIENKLNKNKQKILF